MDSTYAAGIDVSLSSAVHCDDYYVVPPNNYLAPISACSNSICRLNKASHSISVPLRMILFIVVYYRSMLQLNQSCTGVHIHGGLKQFLPQYGIIGAK